MAGYFIVVVQESIVIVIVRSGVFGRCDQGWRMFKFVGWEDDGAKKVGEVRVGQYVMMRDEGCA